MTTNTELEQAYIAASRRADLAENKLAKQEPLLPLGCFIIGMWTAWIITTVVSHHCG